VPLTGRGGSNPPSDTNYQRKHEGPRDSDQSAGGLLLPRTLALATGRPVNELVLCAVRDYLGSAGHREAVDSFAQRARSQYRVALDKLADL
jgi:hypothetical protein